MKENSDRSIGRSDIRHTQRGHTASQGRHGVWTPGTKPIWASGDVPCQQAGKTTAVAPITRSVQKTSCIQGPSKHVTPTYWHREMPLTDRAETIRTPIYKRVA